MYRKLCFYRFEEKLIKCVTLESGGFYVVYPRSIRDGKYCFIIPLKVCETRSVLYSSVKYKNETDLRRGKKKCVNFCQNDPIFPIYDVMLLEQVIALNLLASSLQIPVALLADRGRNKIILL